MAWAYWSRKKSGFEFLDYNTYDLIISFRQLNTDYVGPAIELFRVSDSTIQSFDFVDGELPISDIETWAAGSSFDVEKFYSQGTDPNNVYSFVTARVRLGVDGVMNLDGGRPYVTNPGNAYYQTPFETPEIDQKGILTNDLVYGTVIRTQNDVSLDGLFCERGSSGSLFHCNIFSDTRSNRLAYQRRSDQSTNQTRVWNIDLPQNTKFIYTSRFGAIPSTNSSDAYFYRDNVLRTISTSAVSDTNLYPSGNTLSRFLFRSSVASTGDIFNGQFFELVCKSYKNRPSITDLALERIELNDDMNLYYGIY
jgi:hypothetical protein